MLYLANKHNIPCQREADKMLAKLPCKDTVNQYLLHVRGANRVKKENTFFLGANNLTVENLQKLDDMVRQDDPCLALKNMLESL
jgi:hypothetical protein